MHNYEHSKCYVFCHDNQNVRQTTINCPNFAPFIFSYSFFENGREDVLYSLTFYFWSPSMLSIAAVPIKPRFSLSVEQRERVYSASRVHRDSLVQQQQLVVRPTADQRGHSGYRRQVHSICLQPRMYD